MSLTSATDINITQGFELSGLDACLRNKGDGRIGLRAEDTADLIILDDGVPEDWGVEPGASTGVIQTNNNRVDLVVFDLLLNSSVRAITESAVGDFVLRFKHRCTARGGFSVAYVGLSDVAGYSSGPRVEGNAIWCQLGWGTANSRALMGITIAGSTIDYLSTPVDQMIFNTDTYIEITRTGTTATVAAYSDSAFSVLLGTVITQTCPGVDFNNLYIVQSQMSGPAGRDWTGWIGEVVLTYGGVSYSYIGAPTHGPQALMKKIDAEFIIDFDDVHLHSINHSSGSDNIKFRYSLDGGGTFLGHDGTVGGNWITFETTPVSGLEGVYAVDTSVGGFVNNVGTTGNGVIPKLQFNSGGSVATEAWALQFVGQSFTGNGILATQGLLTGSRI